MLAEVAVLETQKPTTLAVWVNVQELKEECSDRVDNKLVKGVIAVDQQDIARYRDFVVDVDRTGAKKNSSTDAEKAALCKPADDIAAFIQNEMQWPQPKYIADSSNGYHLAWSIDLPATADSQNLLEKCYKALQKRFGLETVKIDTSLGDPN
jgi:hypothetical protein